MRWLLLSALILEVLSPCCVLAQAPGDEDEFCLEISSAPAYAASVKPLLDSWRYTSLLDGDGPWQSLDDDGDMTGWDAIPSSVCQEQVTSTEPLGVSQKDWLFTQHINKSMDPSYTYPVSIFVNVSYTFETECKAAQCIPFIQLFYYLSNNIDKEGSMEPSKYSSLANLSSSIEDLNQMQFSTVNFSIAPENVGFYLGILSTGANVTIHRILTYRLIGPMKQSGLTLLPETPAPISSAINTTGTCAANSNTTNDNLPILTITPTGNWTRIDQCFCIEGHYLDEIEQTLACVACVVGTYKSVQGNDNCLMCPSNSQSRDRGSSICTCLPSFYRSPEENAEDSCTGPPSSPQDVKIISATPSTATVTWNPPTSDGGRTDTFYNISYSLGSTVIYPEHEPINTTNYTLTGLQPCMVYYVLVIAENGVSSQAGEQGPRSKGQVLLTPEGVPKITTVKVLDELYIYWTPLTDDCIEISEYHIQFYIYVSDEAPWITVPSNESIYLVDVAADLPLTGQPIYVRVRGSSQEEGVGEWSDPVVFAEENPNILPTSSSVMSLSSTGTTTSMSESGTTPTTEPGTTTPTTEPGTTTTTPPPSLSGATQSILFVLLGAVIIIIAASVGTLTYWLIRRYCRKYLNHCLPKDSSYVSVKLTRSKVGDEEGRVEFIDGSRDYENEAEVSGDTLVLMKNQ